MDRLAQKVDFVQRRADADEILAYIDGLRPMARLRPAMVSNPMAATNWRSVSHLRLMKRMPDAEACISTPSVSDIPWALDYLLFQKRANIIVLNGGDGTIHHTINAAIETVSRASEIAGVEVPLPYFLFVNGGGMNMLARAFRTRGRPVATLQRFLDRSRGSVLADLPTLTIPLLSVHEGEDVSRYGFIFGSELVLNALFMYERFGRGYRGLTKFFLNLVTAYALKTELWRRFGHLLDPPTTPLVVDEVVHPTYASCVVATAPMTLMRGVVRTLPYRAEPNAGLNTIEILPTTQGAIIGTIPNLLMGRNGPGIHYSRNVQEVRLTGPYTLDGELFQRPSEGKGTAVAVRATPYSVRGIWLP